PGVCRPRRVRAEHLDPLQGSKHLVPDELALLAEAVHLHFQVGHVAQQQMKVGREGGRCRRGMPHVCHPFQNVSTESVPVVPVRPTQAGQRRRRNRYPSPPTSRQRSSPRDSSVSSVSPSEAREISSTSSSRDCPAQGWLASTSTTLLPSRRMRTRRR